jgi:hypothetical protein
MKNIYPTSTQGGVIMVASGIMTAMCGKVFLEQNDWFFLACALVGVWGFMQSVTWFFPIGISPDRVRFWQPAIVGGSWKEIKRKEITKISVKHIVAWGADGILPGYEVGLYTGKNKGTVLRFASKKKMQAFVDLFQEEKKISVITLA